MGENDQKRLAFYTTIHCLVLRNRQKNLDNYRSVIYTKLDWYYAAFYCIQVSNAARIISRITNIGGKNHYEKKKATCSSAGIRHGHEYGGLRKRRRADREQRLVKPG